MRAALDRVDELVGYLRLFFLWRAAHPGNDEVPGLGESLSWLLTRVVELEARVAELEAERRR